MVPTGRLEEAWRADVCFRYLFFHDPAMSHDRHTLYLYRYNISISQRNSRARPTLCTPRVATDFSTVKSSHYLLASRFSRPASHAWESASLPSSSASAYICCSSSPVDLPCHTQCTGPGVQDDDTSA